MEQSKDLPKIISKGTSQGQRRAAHLDPKEVPVDNEGLPNLLTFLYQFSRLLNHFDENKTVANWSLFFEESEPVKIARIGTFDTFYFYNTYQKKESDFEKEQQAVHLTHLFLLQFEMAVQVDKWHGALSDGNELKIFTDNIIKTNLRNALINLFKLANAVVSAGICPTLKNHVIKYRGYFSGLEQRKTWGFSLKELLLPEPSFVTIKSSKQFKERQVKKLLEDTFYFLNISIIRIPQIARDIFEKSLFQSDEHEPHMALIFAFLKIYKQAQGDLNRITKRHLDFFYREVLKIKEKESVPDSAHVVFGLSKHVQQHVLEKEMQLVAGEDNNGTPIHFQLAEELVVTEAQVKTLSTMFLPLPPKPCVNQDPPTPDHLFYTPFFTEVAFAKGIEGQSFAELNPPGWHSLGASEYGSVGDEEMTPYPTADLGLLVACGNFNLKEGDRTIHLRITAEVEKEALFVPDLKNALQTEYALDEAAIKALEKNGVATFNIPNKVKKEHQTFWGNDDDFFGKLNNAIIAEGGKGFNEEKEKVFLKHAWRNNLFDVYYSTEEGWKYLKEVEIKNISSLKEMPEKGGGKKIMIQLKMHLDASEMPFIPHADLYPYPFAKEFPLLKLVFSPSFKPQNEKEFKNRSLYHFLRQLKITDIETDVSVDGLKNMVAQNDEGLQDINSSVLPFGVAPKKGADFYLGGMEVFFKNLTSLDIHLEWEDLPDSFTEHYKMYGEEVKASDFKAETGWLLEKKWEFLKGVELFKTATAGGTTEKLESTTTLSFGADDFKEFYSTSPEPSERLTVNTMNGYFRLRLGERDFLNDLYPAAVIQQASAIAAQANGKALKTAFYSLAGGAPALLAATDIGKKGSLLDNKDYKVELPKEPYLPKLSSISIDYTAKDDKHDILLFHLYPHEGTFKAIDLEKDSPTLLPFFTEEGQLFIGLEKVVPGSLLNLFFQMAESTGNPEAGRARVEWSYLADNEWKPLRKDFNILSDGTMGLLDSGVIQFSLPGDISTGNTSFNANLSWIRASCAVNADAVSKAVAIHTQTAKVVFEKQANSDLTRLGHPLPAGSIGELLKVDSSIEQVLQPFGSFGGRPEETPTHFYTRASEHLRHKGRAITSFDYERLVLEAFPELHLAKCIHHTLGRGYCNRTYEMAPGYVTLAVIPDIAQQKNANRLTPKMSLSQLDKIKGFLQSKISPFVRLQVLNPRYEPVRTQFKVKFRKGKSPSFYQDQLDEQIKRYLSPWAYDDGRSISFGNVMEQSAIVDFIEKEEYVDYITDFKFLREEGEKVEDEHLFSGQTPLSVLFSDRNIIEIVTSD